MQKYSLLKTGFFTKDFKMISGYEQVVNNGVGLIKRRIASKSIELLRNSIK
jgi:hypothetical protein